jgi:hypothetical protein
MISLTTLSKKLSLLCVLILGLQGFTVQGMEKKNIFEGIREKNPTERTLLFQALCNEYKTSTIYSDDNRLALKEELIRMNKTSKATVKDIVRCFEALPYSLHTIEKEDTNSRIFFDTILPFLLEGHDFSDKEYQKNNNFYPHRLLNKVFPNSYVIKNLLYFYGVPLNNSVTGDGLLYFLVFDNLVVPQCIDEDRITYIRKILTPPDRLIQEAKELSLPIIETFLLCAKRFQPSLSHRLPKRLVNTHIIPAIIDNANLENFKARCQQIKSEVKDQMNSKYITKELYGYNNVAFNFLVDEGGSIFESWFDKNTNLAALAYPKLFGSQ